MNRPGHQPGETGGSAGEASPCFTEGTHMSRVRECWPVISDQNQERLERVTRGGLGGQEGHREGRGHILTSHMESERIRDLCH